MELLSFSIVVFVFILSFFILLSSIHSKSRNPIEEGFKTYPIVGTLPVFLLNRHRYLDWSTEILSKCPTNSSFVRRPGKGHGIITANPSIIEYILKTNFDNYPKGARFLSLLEDFLGKGIFNSDDELWRIQRKTASYEFNTKSLRNFVMENFKVEMQTRLIPLLENYGKTDKSFDMQDILERFAFDNICKLAFNVDPGCLGGDGTAGAEFMKAFEDASNYSSGRFMYALPAIMIFKKFFNIGSEKTLRKSIAKVHEFADKIIKSRLEDKDVFVKKSDEDLLSRFMGGDSGNSVEFLRDIIISFILAGRDTTSSALTWFFWLLSSRPEIENKILEELRHIRERNGKMNVGETYSFDELREMHYLHASISEAMRLYPPVPIDTKACLSNDILPDGTFIGKGWFISYHTYAMGRMENIWGKDCLEYKPERWIENGICKQENPYKYPVFHAGPRMCLGKDMAYIQMKSIAAAVLERFRIEVAMEDDGKCPEYVLSLTLRMKGGLLVKAKERSVKKVG